MFNPFFAQSYILFVTKIITRLKMSESRERAIRRLKYLSAERNDKVEEINQLSKSIEIAGRSGKLRALIGDPQTTILSMEQMNARIRDIGSEVRRIDYEIDELESQLKKNNAESTEGSYVCAYCGAENEEGTVFCNKCGRLNRNYVK
jgi:hypothetical protein